MKPNYDRLETVIEATEKETLSIFAMNLIYKKFDICGTAGCLIGNYNEYMNRDRQAFNKYIAISGRLIKDWDHFAISEIAYDWLFDIGMILRTSYSASKIRTLSTTTKEQALSRVRKFIEYFKRKDEIFADLERARRQEGNWMVSKTVVERVAERETKVAI